MTKPQLKQTIKRFRDFKKLYTLEDYLNDQYKDKPKELAKINKEAEKLIIISDLIQQIVKIRLNSGLTQTAIARKLNVKTSFISRIERGDIDFRISTLIKYLKILRLEIKFVKTHDQISTRTND